MGVSYLVGRAEEESGKPDLFYTVAFIRPALQLGPYRLATVEEKIAMKIDYRSAQSEEKGF